MDTCPRQQHLLAVEHGAHRVELTAHRELARALIGHDEGAPHVPVLHQTPSAGSFFFRFFFVFFSFFFRFFFLFPRPFTFTFISFTFIRSFIRSFIHMHSFVRSNVRSFVRSLDLGFKAAYF